MKILLLLRNILNFTAEVGLTVNGREIKRGTTPRILTDLPVDSRRGDGPTLRPLDLSVRLTRVKLA